MMQVYFERRSGPPSPSSGRAKQTWYFTPPSLQIYDHDITSIFLENARTHLSKTFALFADFKVTLNTREELCLAMAAVGGLYCQVTDSFKIAKAMYNDARRLLLASRYRGMLSKQDHSFDDVMTFMLLEIYGLCSGDKRSYEFVEAFHMNLLQAVQDCELQAISSSSSGAEIDGRRRLLMEGLFLLDGYRVILLQRPPTFPSTYANVSHRADALPSPETDLSVLLNTIFTPGGDIDTGSIVQHSLVTLMVIASFVWAVAPRAAEHSGRASTWKVESLELALEQWIRLQKADVDWSLLMLYHMLNIILHSNLSLLQQFTHPPSSAGTRSPSRTSLPSIQSWASSRHYVVAQWHAEALLDLAKERLGRPNQSIISKSRTAAREMTPTLIAEAPHTSHCIYYSTLVLWCGNFVRNSGSSSCMSYLDQGAQLLSSLKVRIAEPLENVLRELKNRLPEESAFS